MSVNNQHAMTTQELAQGLVILKKRQRNLMLLSVGSACVFIAAGIGFYSEQDLIYSFFGLSQEVKQLHIPSSVQGDLADWGRHPDYFLSLLSWFGWLILKVIVAFFGAFISVRLLKKIRYFAIRFQSFVLRFVGWLIAFIMIWSGLTYWQHESNNDQNQAYEELVYYDQNIQNSELARELTTQPQGNVVNAYLLAQTALLHQPADVSAAKPYVNTLMRAEKDDPNFENYGFRAEQIRALQQQTLNQDLSPLAKSIEPKMTQADQVRVYVRYMLSGLLVLSFVLAVLFYLLSTSIHKRTLKIEQRILK